MEWGRESSDMVVTEVKSIYRLLRPLKPEKQLQKAECIASRKIL